MSKQADLSAVAVKYKLSDDAVLLVLKTAARHVFEGNFKCPFEEVPAVSREDLATLQLVALRSDFVRLYGDFNGLVCIQMPRELVSRIAEDSLGLDAFREETFAGEAILRDAAGEIVNMLAGTFKNMLSRVKLNCRLLPPERFDDDSELVSRMLRAENCWVLNVRLGGHLSQITALSVKA